MTAFPERQWKDPETPLPLGELLERYGFTYHVDGDNLFSRCGRCGSEYIYTWHAPDPVLVSDARTHVCERHRRTRFP